MAASCLAALLALGAQAAVGAPIFRFAYIGQGGRNDWFEGFHGLFLPRIQANGGFQSGGVNFSVEVVDYIINDLPSNPNQISDLKAAVAAAAQGTTLDGTVVGPIDVIIAGTNNVNVPLMQAAEPYGIPNVHCSGGNPAFWSSSRPHAFGLHVPFTGYSQGAIASGTLRGLKTVSIFRSTGWQFTATSAIAALEWSLQNYYKVIGPTVQWCNRWQAFTTTCRVVTLSTGEQRCVCGLQSEVDALGYTDLKIEAQAGIYEIADLKVAEPGFAIRASRISANISRFAQGIIDDIRSQGGDPDLVVCWVEPARSYFYTAFQNDFKPKMWVGAPDQGGPTVWSGVFANQSDGVTPALNDSHALYTVGGGQWHYMLRTTDPLFNTNAEYVAGYRAVYGGRNPTYDAAACTTAGIVTYLAVTKYAAPLNASDVLQRREALRQAIGNVNDNTLFGATRFNRMGQNNGRGAVAWQFLPAAAPGSGSAGVVQVVLPQEIAQTALVVPMPTWAAKFGCAAGTFNTGTECAGCPAGTFNPSMTPGLTATKCSQCPKTLGTTSTAMGATVCEVCPAGFKQDGNLDQGICRGCAAGTFRNDSMPAGECSLCPRGTFGDSEASSVCTTCPDGTYQTDKGQVACVCQVGWYRKQSPSRDQPCAPCEALIRGSTTRYSGSISPEDCECPVGWYLVDGQCHSCEDDFADGSVVCAGFGAPPVLTPGWMTLHNDPVVYKCARTGNACPGGVPVGVQACSPGGTDVACGWCLDGYRFDAQSGMCTECAKGNSILWLCFAVLGAATAIALRPPTEEYGETTLLRVVRTTFITLALSQIVDMLQICSIWSGSAIQWSGNENAVLFSIGGLFAFNTMSPDCDLKGTRETHAIRIVILMNLIPAFFIAFVLLVSLPDMVSPAMRRWRMPSRINGSNMILGAVVSFFTTILNLAINLVFSMYEHPHIGRRSLRVFPYVLDTSKDMDGLRAVAGCSLAVWCVGTFVVVSTLALYLQTNRPSLFMRRCTVALIVRYRDGYNWWLIVEMLLKFLVAISVAIFERPDVQLQWMILVFVVYLVLLVQFKPYRFLRHTLGEVVFTCGKILVVVLVMTSVYRAGPSESGVFGVLLAIFGLCFLYLLWCAFTLVRGRATEPATDYETLAVILYYFGYNQDPRRLFEVVPESDTLRHRLGLGSSEMVAMALERAASRRGSGSLGGSGKVEGPAKLEPPPAPGKLEPPPAMHKWSPAPGTILTLKAVESV